MMCFRTHVYIKLSQSQANTGTIHKDVVEYNVHLRIPQKNSHNAIEILPQLEINLQSSYTCGPHVMPYFCQIFNGMIYLRFLAEKVGKKWQKPNKVEKTRKRLKIS